MHKSLTLRSAAYRSSISDRFGPSAGHHTSAANTFRYQSINVGRSSLRWMTWYMSPNPYGPVLRIGIRMARTLGVRRAGCVSDCCVSTSTSVVCATTQNSPVVRRTIVV